MYIESDQRLISEIPPEEVTSSVAGTIAEVQKRYRQRKTAVELSVKRGSLHFLVHNLDSLRERRVQILYGKDNESLNCYFGHIVEDMPISHISNPEHPMEILLKDRSTGNPLDIAKSLGEFIADHFPEATGLPIYLYDSLKSYKAKNPLVSLKHPENA